MRAKAPETLMMYIEVCHLHQHISQSPLVPIGCFENLLHMYKEHNFDSKDIIWYAPKSCAFQDCNWCLIGWYTSVQINSSLRIAGSTITVRFFSWLFITNTIIDYVYIVHVYHKEVQQDQKFPILYACTFVWESGFLLYPHCFAMKLSWSHYSPYSI